MKKTKQPAYFRIISDVHGHYNQYLDIIKHAKYSVQLGDMAFDYSFMNNVDIKHRLLAGNHDNYDKLCDHHLGDFGTHKSGSVEFFYIRGGMSIDWRMRAAHEITIGYKCFWTNEQLSIPECTLAFEEYKKSKPKVVLTHSCPRSIINMFGDTRILKLHGFDPSTFTTNTQELLQKCFEYHQPDLWVFGHFHKNWSQEVGVTKFICLDELNYIDLDKKGDFYVKC